MGAPSAHLKRLAELEKARAATRSERVMWAIFHDHDYVFVDPAPGPKFVIVRQRAELAGAFEIRVMKRLSQWGGVVALMTDQFFEIAERLLGPGGI